MAVETSIDALAREFEIEDVRDEVPTAEKQKQQQQNPVTEAQTAPDPVKEVVPEDPMSFLNDDQILAPSPTPPTPPVTEIDGEDEGPSIAELKEKVKKDHKEIVSLEQEVKIQQRYDLEDRAYMKAQLKSLISDNRAVMDCIESQLEIGVNPHLFDIYANLSKTVADNIMRLAKIDETITNYKIVEDKGTGNIKHDVAKDQAAQQAANGQAPAGSSYTQINNTFNFGSQELLKLIKSAMPKVEKVKQEDLPKFNLQ